MKKVKLFLCLLIILVIFSPIIVNSIIVSPTTHGFKVVNNNDWISFYGSIIGGLITLVGVALTIVYTSYQNREQDRKGIKPYISITQLYKNSIKDEVAHLTNDDYKIGLIAMVNNEKRSANDLMIDELSFYGFIKNIGIGTAINIQFVNMWIENKKISCGCTNVKNSLEVGAMDFFRIELFNIVVEDKDLSAKYKKMLNDIESVKFPNIHFRFDIIYEDMLGNKYKQHSEIEVQIIDRGEEKKRFNVLFDNVSHPKEINTKI
ncbi:hypothetical protein ACE1TI_16335 [Alteribacillus sp. JSM 102045]|uniref:hypothetical protein n=1 Tax=Alteribacillus sp. JSM 102045 TaxID=1562101 RepID=UPI0035BFF085